MRPPPTATPVQHKPVFQRSATAPLAPVPPSHHHHHGHDHHHHAAKPKLPNFFIEPHANAMYVMIASAAMMVFACWIPFYLAVCMLFDKHYRTWIGWESPTLVVLFTLFMPLAFVGCIYVILRRGHGAGVRTEETMVLVGATFTSLLGVVLCLLAIPMSSSAALTIQQLSFGCDLADPTSARLVFHSQVLHNIRNGPNCMGQGSVKDCEGWKSNKYTEYLQRLEQDFDCTGLCTLPAPPTAPPKNAIPVVAPHHASGKVYVGPTDDGATTGPQGLFLNQQSWARSRTNRTKTTLSIHKAETQTQESASSEDADPNYSVIPALKLYSQEKTDQRCYPLVADRLQVMSSTAGELLFWLGIGLLFVSVAAGSVKVIDKTLFEK
jgi:hypothetical protein